MKATISALRSKHKKTLELIFTNPVLSNLKWSDVESLIKALGGEIKQGRGSRCRFFLNNSMANFHRPHPSPDTDIP